MVQITEFLMLNLYLMSQNQRKSQMAHVMFFHYLQIQGKNLCLVVILSLGNTFVKQRLPDKTI